MPPPNPFLLNAGHESSWQNLGDWSSASDYPKAAHALATGLGNALGLRPNDRLIDVGCGSGDQLLVWRQQFGVRTIVGLEPFGPSAARATAKAEGLDGVSVTAKGAEALQTNEATAVLSLDAAYHFAPRRAFLARAARALPPGGRLGLTDLFTPSDRPDLRARMLALFAGIPARNLWSTSQWRNELTDAGFVIEAWTDLTPAVLGGFGRWGRTAAQAFWRQPRWDWLPIWATALAAANAARYGWLGYVRVVARRTSTGTKA